MTKTCFVTLLICLFALSSKAQNKKIAEQNSNHDRGLFSVGAGVGINYCGIGLTPGVNLSHGVLNFFGGVGCIPDGPTIAISGGLKIRPIPRLIVAPIITASYAPVLLIKHSDVFARTVTKLVYGPTIGGGIEIRVFARTYLNLEITYLVIPTSMVEKGHVPIKGGLGFYYTI